MLVLMLFTWCPRRVRLGCNTPRLAMAGGMGAAPRTCGPLSLGRTRWQSPICSRRLRFGIGGGMSLCRRGRRTLAVIRPLSTGCCTPPRGCRDCPDAARDGILVPSLETMPALTTTWGREALGRHRSDADAANRVWPGPPHVRGRRRDPYRATGSQVSPRIVLEGGKEAAPSARHLTTSARVAPGTARPSFRRRQAPIPGIAGSLRRRPAPLRRTAPQLGQPVEV